MSLTGETSVTEEKQVDSKHIVGACRQYMCLRPKYSHSLSA